MLFIYYLLNYKSNDSLFFLDNTNITTPLNINEFTMEEFFGNNWIEYKGVECNA